jgi:uncharacterized protein YprB with RNaseH-like and TPR domain
MMSEQRCIHRHTIKTHPNCFKKGLIKYDWWDDKRIAYLDIETSDLKANFGIVLSWCLKYKNDKHIYSAVITKKDLESGTFDKRIVKELLDTLENVDIIVTYYGTYFDVPFLRTRAEKYRLAFPKYGSIFHWDLYFKAKKLFATHRKSLGVITNFLGIAGKTPLDPEIWFIAQYGDVAALREILFHNEQDVIILEKLHKRIEEYTKWDRKSL